MANKKNDVLDPSKPLKNIKYEKFCNNVAAGMTYSEAYHNAGYKQTGDNAKKSAERILRTVDVLKPRIEHLRSKINVKIEEKGVRTKEELLNKLYYALELAIGIEDSEHCTFVFGKLAKGKAKKTNLGAVASISDKIAKLQGWENKEENFQEQTRTEKALDKLEERMAKRFGGK